MSPLWISIATAFTATAITFVLGIAAAWAMSRYRGRARGLLDGILILPLVLPPTVVGFFLLLLFGSRSAVGQLLQQIGITVAFSWTATVIAATVVAFPLMYRTTLGAFEQVTPNMLAAARTLGAGEWRIFRRILLPLAWPGVMAGTVLAFARALGEFGATLMLAGNIPGRTQTMPVAIFFAAEGGDLRGAFMWVAWIAALSLGTIAAMNYWSQPRRRRSRPPAEVPEPAPMHLAAAPRPRSEIHIEILKSHPGFTLAPKFASAAGTLGVLGASGSGKSMTLRCIAGLERPDAGRIAINGRVLFDSAARICLPAAARRIGIVFQDYALFPHLTVRENIAFGLRARAVEEWARLTHVEPLLDRYPHELSGGQQQRVAMARALAMEPEALLLDEPLAALDPHLRRSMEQQLRAVMSSYAGAAIFVTHDRSEAYRLCDDLVVLSEGRVAACGPKHELFDNPGTLAAARVTGCRNIAAFELAGTKSIRVPEWGCTLQLEGPIPDGATHVGIRAHHVEILTGRGEDNSFRCGVAGVVRSPFEVTMYLDCKLEADLPLEHWERLPVEPAAWYVRLPPDRLLLLRS